MQPKKRSTNYTNNTKLLNSTFETPRLLNIQMTLMLNADFDEPDRGELYFCATPSDNRIALNGLSKIIV